MKEIRSPVSLHSAQGGTGFSKFTGRVHRTQTQDYTGPRTHSKEEIHHWHWQIRRDLTVRGRCRSGVRIEIKGGVPASKIGSYGVDSLKSEGLQQKTVVHHVPKVSFRIIGDEIQNNYVVNGV